MKKGSILVVGSFVMDMITKTRRFPQAGETVLGDAFHTAPGGKGANQAVQVARLGASVTMVGRVGNDSFGSSLIGAARTAGINTSHITIDTSVPTATGNVILQTDENGNAQNRIIVNPGANMTLTQNDILWIQGVIHHFDAVMLQLEIPMAVNLLTAQIANEAGIPVLLNPAPAAELPDELLKNITFLTPNEYEAQMITGIHIYRSGEEVDLADVRRAAHALLECGIKHAVITLGSAGAFFSDSEQEIYVPAVKGLGVVDPTAAGDSFLGAFAFAFTTGADMKTAMQFSSIAAAITVSRMGAMPSLPHIDEVLPLLKKYCGQKYSQWFEKGNI